MTQEQAAKIVLILARAYPTTTVNAETAEVYETMLADLDFGEAQRGLAEVIRTVKFFPSVAEIREAVSMQQARRKPPPLQLVPKSERVPYAEVVQLIGTIGRRP